jgi:dihydrofolate reductase
LVASFINAGLLDELRLIVHPVAGGAGMSLFARIDKRQAFTLMSAEPTASGRVNLAYRLQPESTNG